MILVNAVELWTGLNPEYALFQTAVAVALGE